MTPQELKDFRARMGWTREELARQLEVSPSRLMDYELGQTRTNPPRPAPIPKVVELACRWLEEHNRPLTLEEKIALWRDDAAWGARPGPPMSDEMMTREGIYRDSERGW